MTHFIDGHGDVREVGEHLPKIKTDFVYPPIPIRQFDWTAWYDSIGEEGPSGSGPTEQAAISDLTTNYPPEDYGL